MTDNTESLHKILTEWQDTYAAFHGAFNTPAARRAVKGEYADDARQRMMDFNSLLWVLCD